MIDLVFVGIGTFIAFFIGVWHTERKYERILADYRTSYIKELKALQASWENEKRESDAAWEEYFKLMRAYYEKALTEKHSNEGSEGEG